MNNLEEKERELEITLRELREHGWRREPLKDVVDKVCNEIPVKTK